MFDIPTFSAQCASCSTNQVKNNISGLLSGLGFNTSQINLVKTSIGNHAVSPSALTPKITELYNSAPTAVKPIAEYQVKEEAKASTPRKANSSINGAVSDPVIEPINAYVVSTPKDIPDSNNSLEEQHPDTFGFKDKAGNWEKHNVLTGLYQRGLRNGYLFRSDVNGNTTIFIPANHKLNIGRSFNLNAAAMDFILSGPGHIESSDAITIKAPVIELIGDVVNKGNQTITKALTVKLDAEINGKSFSFHSHPGDNEIPN